MSSDSSDYEGFRAEIIRQFPELGRRAVYTGWLLGYLPVDAITGTATGLEAENPRVRPGPGHLDARSPLPGQSGPRQQPVGALPGQQASGGAATA